VQSSDDVLTPIFEASLSQGDRPVDGEEWNRLRRVALECQQRGAPFHEFVNALVHELLQYRLPAAVASATSIPRMSELIGGSLCGDPVSRQRLQELQQQLLGAE
jgi:hypothetical protein